MYSVPVTARARNAPFVQPLHQRPNCPEYTAREAALGYSRSRGFPELQAKRRSRVNIGDAGPKVRREPQHISASCPKPPMMFAAIATQS